MGQDFSELITPEKCIGPIDTKHGLMYQFVGLKRRRVRGKAKPVVAAPRKDPELTMDGIIFQICSNGRMIKPGRFYNFEVRRNLNNGN